LVEASEGSDARDVSAVLHDGYGNCEW
jgi:hypothetical protein